MAVDKDVWVSSQIHDNDWAITFCHPLSPTRLQMLAVLMDTLQIRIFWDTPGQLI